MATKEVILTDQYGQEHRLIYKAFSTVMLEAVGLNIMQKLGVVAKIPEWIFTKMPWVITFGWNIWKPITKPALRLLKQRTTLGNWEGCGCSLRLGAGRPSCGELKKNKRRHPCAADLEAILIPVYRDFFDSEAGYRLYSGIGNFSHGFMKYKTCVPMPKEFYRWPKVF